MSNVVFPNFRSKVSHWACRLSIGRALVFVTNQKAYDAILMRMTKGKERSEQEVIARALERYLELGTGEADPPAR